MISISRVDATTEEILRDNLHLINRDMVGSVDTIEINKSLFRVKKDNITYKDKKFPCLKFYGVWKKEEGYELEEIFPKYIGFIGKERNLVANPFTGRMEIAMFLDKQLEGHLK